MPSPTYGRNDWRDPAKEKFGKPTVSFPEGDLKFPTVDEEGAARKDSTAGAINFLTDHPKVKGGASSDTPPVLVEQTTTKGDDDSSNQHLKYEMLPGPVITSVEMSEQAQGALVTVTKQKLKQSADAYSPDWKTLEYKDTGIDVNRKMRTLVTLGGGTAVAEVSSVNLAGSTPQGLAGKYFTIWDASGPVYVWFNGNGITDDPHPTGYRGIPVVVNYGTAEVSQFKWSGALTGSGLWGKYFILYDASSKVYGWFQRATGSGYAVTGDSTTDVLTVTGLTMAENDPISFSILAGGAGLTAATQYYAVSVSGSTFKISDSSGGAAIDFTTDITAGTIFRGLSSVDPAPSGSRGIPIYLPATASSADILSAITLTFNNDAGFAGCSASVVPGGGGTPPSYAAVITDATGGTRANAAAGTSGFTATTLVNGTGTATDSVITMATAVKSAIAADDSFYAVKPTDDSTEVHISDVATGERNNVAAGTSGLSVSTIQQGSGSSDFPILTDYDQDPEMLSLITTTFQVVQASAVTAPSAVNGVITRFKHIDKWRSLKIVETYALPAAYDEQRFGAAPMPALFDYTLYSYSDQCGAFSQIRAAFAADVQTRVHVYFTTTKQTISGLTLIPKTLQLGKGVQVHQGVLVDTGSFTYSGNCVGTVSFTGSSPDYSTYVSSIQGTEQLITGESTLWKAGYYKNVALYRTML